MHGRIAIEPGADKPAKGLTRRNLLIGGGAGAGLLVGWAIWPRNYQPNLTAAPGESIFNAFLRIGTDGRVIVAVPQAEMGQGVYTSLPQILADELGADWRTVAVEPAPINPLYANHVFVEEMLDKTLPAFLHGIDHWAARQISMRLNLTMTGGSSSIRAFEERMREAGAAARALLCMAAAARWKVDWAACDTAAGFVTRGEDRLRFGELAEAASRLQPPSPLPLRAASERTLVGTSVPRLDLPSKVDGSAQFGADVRLPDMVYASISHGPYGDARPVKSVLGDADAVPGVMGVVTNPHWIAVVGTNWWAADRGLKALATEFETRLPRPDTLSIRKALRGALGRGDAKQIVDKGDVAAALSGAGVIDATYSVPMLPHAPMETLTATARFTGDRLEIWVPTQSAPFARAAVAAAIGIDEHRITLYPTLVGGGFGRKVEVDAAVEAALIARQMRRPVQLVWSRSEDIQHSRFRPPVLARLRGKIGAGAAIAGWHATIAAPATTAEMLARLQGKPKEEFGPESAAVEGAEPPYAIGALGIDHAVAAIGVDTGAWRSVGNSYTAFFTESFMDELALHAGLDPLSFRIQALGPQPRLARCLSMATSIGGWEGGEPGVGQGIAVHSCFGSHVAMMAEVSVAGDQLKVHSITAVVDCGRAIHPDILRQQIEGGIIWGLGNALGEPIRMKAGTVTAQSFDGLGLPTLTDTPDIRIEIVQSNAAPGGAGEIAVPPVAPAIANAIFAATGKRLRNLPLRIADA
ncbi:MAG: aldehyde oxidase [Rhizorhabdus sp.]|nr:aldehyde oxidase [Rhizorhabdus sp.]